MNEQSEETRHDEDRAVAERHAKEVAAAYEEGRRTAIAQDDRISCARTSPAIGELLAAMACAQGAIETAKKDRENPAFRSKYADLASVIAACREPLAANGLTVLQIPRVDLRSERPIVRVSTILGHKSGQWIETALDIPTAKGDAQGIGSATSYGRRYALMSILGIASDDDDGNGASGRDAEPSGQRTPPRAPERQAPPATTAAPPKAAAAPPPPKDDAWAERADQLSARIVDAPSTKALAAIGKEISDLPKAFQERLRPAYNQRARELSPAPNGAS